MAHHNALAGSIREGPVHAADERAVQGAVVCCMKVVLVRRSVDMDLEHASEPIVRASLHANNILGRVIGERSAVALEDGVAMCRRNIDRICRAMCTTA